ncbi:MAG: hypothetical protein KAW00_07235 [Dehalococcoidia bacterium]|nr:hypothetical protein [Dehalococcoidia bacterium]
MNNELENLLVNGKEVDRKLIAEILSQYLKIDKETLDIRPLSPWNNAKAYIKVLLFLIARKAMKALGLDLPEEAVSPAEVIRSTGLKSGTVYPALRWLLDTYRVVEQTADGKYYIPNHAIEKVKAMINES